MGGHPWFYIVPYQPDFDIAMETLKGQEFAAGRYNPAQRYLDDPITSDAPNVGAKHASVAAAMKASGADGTRSILDMERVSRKPGSGVMVPLSSERLKELFGTDKPTREMLDETDDYFEEVDRGQGICMYIYKDGKPVQICFVGCSYD